MPRRQAIRYAGQVYVAFSPMPSAVQSVAGEAIACYVAAVMKNKYSHMRKASPEELRALVTLLAKRIEVFEAPNGLWSVYNNFVMTPVLGLVYDPTLDQWYQDYETNDKPVQPIPYDTALDLATELSDIPISLSEANEFLAAWPELSAVLQNDAVPGVLGL